MLLLNDPIVLRRHTAAKVRLRPDDTDAHLHIVFSSSFSLKKERTKKRRSRQCPLGQLAYFPALTLKPAINSRLACFPLALFVWVHPARYVKRLASRLSMIAVEPVKFGFLPFPFSVNLRNRRGTDLDPQLSDPANYHWYRSTANALRAQERLNVKGTTKGKKH
jgi:hypothetical protein